MRQQKLLIFACLSTIAACGGGGGGGGGVSSPPSPSLTTNLPSSAFDDETIVVTVNARNFGTGVKTYNATSNSLTIVQGNADNEFVIDGIYSDPGSHTITFSASDTSGANASLNSSIRIDAVPTGFWSVTSVIVGGESLIDGFVMFSTISRGGRIFSYARTLQDDGSYVYEKCFGGHSISTRNLTFEAWCGDSIDRTYVDEENYRISGSVVLTDDFASGTYSVYESSGALLGQADVELERQNPHSDLGLAAPSDLAGVYIGSGGWWPGASNSSGNRILTIDDLGNIASSSTDGGCVIEGSVAQSSVELNDGNDFVQRGIFDGVPLSQIGCFDEGNFGSGNRDILAGEGILELYPSYYDGFALDDEELWIYMSDSANSYTGIPSVHIYYRLCAADGTLTTLGQEFVVITNNAFACAI